MSVRDRPDRENIRFAHTGPIVRQCRTLAGLSQVEFAERLGTKQSVISRWESGRDVPRLDTLGRILSACGFEADLVFRRRDDVDHTQIARSTHQTPDERLAEMLGWQRLVAGAGRPERA